MLKQIALLPAGNNPWFKSHLVASCSSASSDGSGDNQLGIYFAYCSTLSIHRLICHNNSVHFLDLITPFEDAISCIAWSNSNPEVWAVATIGKSINFIQWKLTEIEYSVLFNAKSQGIIEWMDFSPHNSNLFAYLDGSSCIKVSNVELSSMAVSGLASISHDVKINSIQWHPVTPCRLLFGDSSGNVYLVDISVLGPSKAKFLKKKVDCYAQAAIIINSISLDFSKSSKVSFSVELVKADPFSEAYVLVSYSEGALLLIDILQDKVISNFEIMGKVNALEWLYSVPGGFVTTDNKTATLKYWSVSMKLPLESVKLINSIVHTITPLMNSSMNKENFPTMQNYLILTFNDGSYGLFDSIKKIWRYLRVGGHTETIFACDVYKSIKDQMIKNSECFDPYYPIILATASYDGTIKVWDLGNTTINVPDGYFLSDSINTSKATLNQSTIGFPKISALNNRIIPQNVGLYANQILRGAYPQSPLENDPSTELSLLDSYPILTGNNSSSENFSHTSKYGIWFCVSWNAENYKFVAGSSKGIVLIYDAKASKVIGELKDLHSQPVYKVTWNSYQGLESYGCIATCSGDGLSLVINSDTGKVVRKYRHPSEAFGCDWNPFMGNVLSTGCKDGKVYIWDMSTTKESPKIILDGHRDRVFSTSWSPLLKNALATGSDDNEIRIWDVQEEANCLSVLKGHMKKVRGIVWHTELSSILLSGSWDSDIRLWNVHTGECLSVVKGHVADVYGLSSISTNPFIFISCSRDNTTRIWSMEDQFKESQRNIMEAIAKNSVEEAVSILQGGNGSMGRFEGKMSLWLVNVLRSKKLDKFQKISAVSRFFNSFKGIEPLRRALVSKYSKNTPSTLTVPEFHDGIFRILSPEKILKFFEIKAQSLESVAILQQLQNGKIVLPTAVSLPAFLNSECHINPSLKVELSRIRHAAFMRLKTGDIKSYCESLSMLGEWDKALAIAPSVSYEYWAFLLKKYLSNHNWKQISIEKKFANCDGEILNDVLIPYYVASGEMKECIDFLLEKKDFETSYVLAAAADIKLKSKKTPEKESNFIGSVGSSVESEYLDSMRNGIFKKFSTRLAASWNILIGKTDAALGILKENENEDFSSILSTLLKE